MYNLVDDRYRRRSAPAAAKFRDLILFYCSAVWSANGVTLHKGVRTLFFYFVIILVAKNPFESKRCPVLLHKYSKLQSW